MARTIRRSRKKKNRLSFLPESLQAFIARRVVDTICFILFISGGFLALALTTYNSSDPSWNSAGVDETTANWMGSSGAFIADMLLQTIGASAFLLSLTLIVWSARLYKRESLSPLWGRLSALMIAIPATTLALSQISSFGWLVHPKLGSSFGTLGITAMAERFSAISPLIDAGIIAGVMGVIAAAAALYALAVRREELAFAVQSMKAGMLICAMTLVNLVRGFINWIAHYNDPDYEPEPLFDFNIRLPQLSDVRAAIQNRIPPRMSDNFEPGISGPVSRAKPAPPTEKLSPFTASRLPGVKKDGSIPVVSPTAKKPQKSAQQSFTLDNSEWDLPSITLLQDVPDNQIEDRPNEGALRKNAELLQNVLADFGVEGDITSIHPGPVVTLYELEPAPGVKSSKVISLSDDIARSMSAVSVRCAVVPGRNVIGIELPNKTRQTVYMRELVESDLVEKSKAHLPLILGKDIGGQPILADLAKMPHLLVAGTTGSGKSVAVNTMILSLLLRLPPEKCRFIMIDPKMLELSVYDDIPHLLSPVVTEPGKAVVALKWTVAEMENRYRAMSKLGVRNIEGYNERLAEAHKKGETIMEKIQTGFDPETGEGTFQDQEMDLTELPYIVVVVDEFADLMLVAGKDVENAIQRLAQMARAAGIHLIMATQRPSVDVITGVIKANFPTRISFQVTSKIDSRTILGEGGAEQLLGMGDMLYMAPGGRITRVHGPFVSDSDVEKITSALKAQGAPAYLDAITDGGDFGDSEVMNAMFGDGGGSSDVDELYDQAVAIIAREGKASTSFIQRHLQIGYNRAARIIEEMERQGVVSKASPTGKREVLVQDFSGA